jgi:trehalose-phosphatase
MRYLFEHWESIKKRVKTARKVFILSDYDGTLTPIVSKPDLAILSEEMRQLLHSIVDHENYKLAIVSGRTAEDIKKLVNINRAFYVGNHGLEIIGSDLHLIYPEAKRTIPVMKMIQEKLQKELNKIEGLIIEDKQLTLSVHFRLVPKKYIATIKKAVKIITREHTDVRVTSGKKVLEIRPNIPWDKGKAALWVVRSIGEDVLPICLGDDKTDEDAFKAMKDGITILVAERKKPSNAKYFVRNISEVQQFFNKLLKK